MSIYRFNYVYSMEDSIGGEGESENSETLIFEAVSPLIAIKNTIDYVRNLNFIPFEGKLELLNIKSLQETRETEAIVIFSSDPNKSNYENAAINFLSAWNELSMNEIHRKEESLDDPLLDPLLAIKCMILPEIGSVWMHTRSKKSYQITGYKFNVITDKWEVTYRPLYPLSLNLPVDTLEFSRQISGHAKAWYSLNDDGTARYTDIKSSV